MVISIMEGEVKVLKHSIVVVFLVELFFVMVWIHDWLWCTERQNLDNGIE